MTGDQEPWATTNKANRRMRKALLHDNYYQATYASAEHMRRFAAYVLGELSTGGEPVNMRFTW